MDVESNIRTAVRKAINSLGGMKSVVEKGDFVVIKPNFVAPRKAATGVTTNLEILAEIAEEVKSCGAYPAIYEFPGMEYDFKKVYEFLELDKFAKKARIHIFQTRRDCVRVNVPGGKVLKDLTIPKVLLKAKIINVPKLKAHNLTGISAGMKNLIGLLPNEERRRMHILGIHQSIVDLNRVIKPCLTVIDATTIMEGDGVYGDALTLNKIVAGADTLYVDNICCKILGLTPSEIKYIQLANKEFGFDSEAVSVAEEMWLGIKRSFGVPDKSRLYKAAYRFMYLVDVFFSRICTSHFNEFLYSTGYFGTRVKIDKNYCEGCGECIDVCPAKGAIDLSAYHINSKRCIRCLGCYDICKKNAIIVKGFSKPSGRA